MSSINQLLTNCGACGNEISIEAAVCPRCGHPNRLTPSQPAFHGDGRYGISRALSPSDESPSSTNAFKATPASTKRRNRDLILSFFIAAAITLIMKKWVEPWVFSGVDWTPPSWAYLILFVALWGYGAQEIAKQAAIERTAYGEPK